jgi:hypothetical protein
MFVSRYVSAAAAICVVATTAWAQDGLRSASLPERNLTAPNPAAPPDVFVAGPRTYTPRRDREGRDRLPYLIPNWFSYPASVTQRVPVERRGYLLLYVEPAAAQVSVDGFYVGTVGDLRNAGGALPAGVHHVEIRAAGYEPQSFNVSIQPDETIRYRADLDSVRPPAPAPRPASPKTFYVIPGCYAGDRHPRDARLPAGCDAAKVRVIPPA